AFDDAFNSVAVPPEALAPVKDGAYEAIADLEEKKSWLVQRLANEQWDKSIEVALKSSVESLARLDGGALENDLEMLNREATLQKANGERDIMYELLVEDIDASIVEGLTKAHFQAISELDRIREMDPETALAEGAIALHNLIQASTIATGQVIRLDGQITVPE